MDIVSVFTKNVIIDLVQDKDGKIEVKATPRNRSEKVIVDYYAGGDFDAVNEKHAEDVAKLDNVPFSIFEKEMNEWDF
jgi:hypothetical protein